MYGDTFNRVMDITYLIYKQVPGLTIGLDEFPQRNIGVSDGLQNKKVVFAFGPLTTSISFGFATISNPKPFIVAHEPSWNLIIAPLGKIHRPLWLLIEGEPG